MEASQLHSDLNCKHFLNITCHAHKRNATEMMVEVEDLFGYIPGISTTIIQPRNR